MVATAASIVLGTPAPQFRLSATNGNTYTLQDIAGSKGTVIIFICNHCPYVKAVIDRVVQNAKVLMAEGIGFAATGEQIKIKASKKVAFRASKDLKEAV